MTLTPGAIPASSLDMKSEQGKTIGVESKIYLIRGQKVMLDFDLAELYQVPTGQLNQQVRRNMDRLPEDFVFSLTKQEFSNLISQFVTSSFTWSGRRKSPLAFTEQGIAMLSSVLHSRRAAEVNIAIMRTFVQLRSVFISNRELEKRITALESKYDGNSNLYSMQLGRFFHRIQSQGRELSDSAKGTINTTFSSSNAIQKARRK